MEKFFEELNSVRTQTGDLPEQPAKRAKLSPMDVLTVNDQPATTINLGDIPTSMGGAELGADAGEAPQQMVENFEPEQASVRKGGRPKLPLFSVRTSRQKARTAKVMNFIRSFAIENQENVDDILWSLLILRVKGSGNADITNNLERLYQAWAQYVSSVPMENMQGVAAIQPMALQGMAPPVAQLTGDMVQLQPQTIHQPETEYPMHQMSIDAGNMLEADQNDIMARV